MIKSPHPLSVNFLDANTDSLKDRVDRSLEIRCNFFYGAVFNALDDYFRKGYAYSLSPADFTTEYKIKEDQFSLIITPTWKNDSPSEDPNDVIRTFLNEIYTIVSSQEMESVTAHGYCDQTTGFPSHYILAVKDKSELMQILEQILKPYDFDANALPTLRHAGVTATSPLCFSMFPQYSLKHIRVMYHNIQGRDFDNQGLYLSH